MTTTTTTPDETAEVKKPRPLQAITAAASRLTRESSQRDGQSATTLLAWQRDAIEMYRLVGEQRFLVNTLAGRLGQAKLFVGKLGDDPTDEPEPMENGKPYDVFNTFCGGNPVAISQTLKRLGINLQMPGDGYIVGIPKQLIDSPKEDADAQRRDPGIGISPIGDDSSSDGNGVLDVDLNDLVWKVFSLKEVTIDRAGDVSLKLSETRSIKTDPDSIFLIRVWNPDPIEYWLADSPARSSLPVLRELVGLTMHVSAQIDSRLTGAGLLVVADSIRQAFINSAGEGYDPDGDDPLLEALITVMEAAREDQSSAAAKVPMVMGVPDEAFDKMKHLTFAVPLDAEARPLREEAIRRLALGQDAPPELLLGVGGMNHWGAWLVREDVVTTHIEPPLATICDALTTQFLWPVLEQQGMSEDEYRQYVVWYDVSHMVVRPNRFEDALKLHERGTITDEALRDAANYDDSDAPAVASQKIDPVVEQALALVRVAPTLVSSPGLPAIVEQLREVIEGKPPEPEISEEQAQVNAGIRPKPDDVESTDDSADEQSTPETSATPSADDVPEGLAASSYEGDAALDDDGWVLPPDREPVGR